MGKAKKRGRGRPRKKETPLSRWIDAAGRSREDVAEKLGITRMYLDRLCGGDRRPSLELALTIEKLTGGAVPVGYWTNVPAHSAD